MHHAMQRLTRVAGADEAAGEGFGGVCQTVVHVREEGEELQQYGIHGQQHGIIHTRRGGGEEGVGGDDAECADDDVAVDYEELAHGRKVHHLAPRYPNETAAVVQPRY